MPEESLSSMQLSFPGQFVQVQYVIALGRDDAQELMDCRLEAVGNAKFRVVNVSNPHLPYPDWGGEVRWQWEKVSLLRP